MLVEAELVTVFNLDDGDGKREAQALCELLVLVQDVQEDVSLGNVDAYIQRIIEVPFRRKDLLRTFSELSRRCLVRTRSSIEKDLSFFRKSSRHPMTLVSLYMGSPIIEEQ